jgi:hypothetical protein
VFQYDGTFSGIPGILVLRTMTVSPTANIRVKGARLVLLGGERALKMIYPNVSGYFYVQWITIHNAIEYVITFRTIPVDYTSLAPNLTTMINTWHWPR